MNTEDHLSHLIKRLEAQEKKTARLVKVLITLVVIFALLAGSAIWFALSRGAAGSPKTKVETPAPYANDTDDKLLAEMQQVWQPTNYQSNFGPDPHLAPTVAILVRAVVLLDRSGTRLAWVGWWLTGVGTVLTIVVSIVPIWPKLKKIFASP